MVIVLTIGVLIGFAAGVLCRPHYLRAAHQYATRRAYSDAGRVAFEAAQFELADTEGQIMQRLDRSRCLYDLAVVLRNTAEEKSR